MDFTRQFYGADGGIVKHFCPNLCFFYPLLDKNRYNLSLSYHLNLFNLSKQILGSELTVNNRGM